MQIVVELPDGVRTVDVRFSDDATVRDLALATVGADPGANAVYLGGRPLSPDTPLAESGIGAGILVSLAPPPAASPGPVDLQILSGPGAGSSLRLPVGDHVVGSGSEATVAYRSPAVASRHAEISVGSHGGVTARLFRSGSVVPIVACTMLDLGGPLLGIGPAMADDTRLRSMPGRRGTVAFNRPPRRFAPPPHMSIEYPEALKPPASTTRLSVVSMIVPLLFGLTLAVLIHPRMALFALLGPVMMAGSWLEDRRRMRKYRRESAEADDTDVREVSAALDAAAATEVVRRHQLHPRVAELAFWPGTSSRLWERRPHHDDFMRLVVGYGKASWRPPMEGKAAAASGRVRRVVAARTALPRGPVPLDLTAGQVLGIAGSRATALDMARSLVCQAAVLHGPADLQIAVITDRPGEWEWAGWLPHTVADDAAERRLLAATAEDRSRLVAMLTPPEPERGGAAWGAPPATRRQPATLLVVDAADLAGVDGAGVRLLLNGAGAPIAGLVMAATVEELPSMCSVVAEVGHDVAHVQFGNDSGCDIAVAGATVRVALDIGRKLAGFSDPDQREVGAELPAVVDLVDLLGGKVPDAESIVRQWRSAGNDPPLLATVGVTEAGPLILDMARDGPHGLLAGTTGSGKSELLRTLIASLALAVDPDHLTFVLIDYKGGSAFDVCAQLPHTVGLVTDLDDQLAERALQSLEAELRYREQRLRVAGADDVTAYLGSDPSKPLPRMMIVIDEFAALAKELPQFMDALVDIAARGRSLGVHLLLATQRPAGVIRDNVRANTNLRMALRVQDRGDSTDVLADPGAASIARSLPGRGYARFGPGELVPFQTALVTGTSGGGKTGKVAVRDRPFGVEAPPFPDRDPGPSEASDLERLVAAVRSAADGGGYHRPRQPWCQPLPETVALVDLDVSDPPTATAVPVGLVDEPDLQRQRTMWWDPAGGSLALYGLTGAGTTSALATIALSLAHRFAPDELHVYVMDFDAGALSPLAELPHVGAVVAAAERERQVRLVRHLSLELERRKRHGGTGDDPLIVVLVDNFSGFATAFDSTADAPIKDGLGRVLTEGPGVGIVAVLTGTRPNAVPLPIAGTIPSKLIFRMADPLAAATFGVRRIDPGLPPGRAIHATSQRTIHIASPHPDGLASAVAAVGLGPVHHRGPPLIEQLPFVVKSTQIAATLRILEEDWWLPVGIGDTDLSPVGLALGPGDHVLVAGEPRSGRSSLLHAIGEVVAAQRPDVEITVIAVRRSPLRDLASAVVVSDLAQIDEAIAQLDGTDGPHLVLIDDVDGIDATPALRNLVAMRRPDLHVIAAGRRDLKTQYNHWARDLCKSRIGVWLAPGPGLDGDLWSTPMPRHIPAGLPQGRGYLITAGAVEQVQTMLP